MRVALLVLLPAMVAAAAPARRVLLIGNSAYEHLPRLRSPKPNVDALAAAFSKMQVQPQAVYDAQQADLLVAVRKFMETVQPGDFALIYFSGYGFQEAATGLNYLLPVGFDPKDKTALSQKALSVRGLESRLEERKAGTKMLLLDASRGAPGLPAGLAMIVPSANQVVSFSAALNQTAADPPDGGVNAYTAALIRAMQTPGSTPASVVAHIQADVARDSGGKQLPFVMQTPVEDLVFTPARPPDPAAGSKQQTQGNPPPMTPSSAHKAGDLALNPVDKLIYAWVPPGTFQMGCSQGDTECEANEKPAHEVKITKGFWMGQTEVPQEAYLKVTGKNPGNPKGAKLPVDGVTWDEARGYCQATGMRLPTEAEWEYAARGGVAGSRYGDLDKIAWQRGNSGGQPREVGGKLPNAYGLQDMLGNVFEWVSDWYADRYTAGSASDPQGPRSGTARTVRGGSWNVLPRYARASDRDRFEVALLSSIGFRCVGN